MSKELKINPESHPYFNPKLYETGDGLDEAFFKFDGYYLRTEEFMDLDLSARRTARSIPGLDLEMFRANLLEDID